MGPAGRTFPGMNPLTERQLVRLARAGSDLAFDVLLRRYERRLRAWIRRRDPDLLQEARLGFLQAVRTWDGAVAFAAFARACALGAVRQAVEVPEVELVSLSTPVRLRDGEVVPLEELLS